MAIVKHLTRSPVLTVQDDTLEETGWKLVHGDVFRPPQRTKLLAALIGSGIQILCVAFVVIGELALPVTDTRESLFAYLFQ